MRFVKTWIQKISSKSVYNFSSNLTHSAHAHTHTHRKTDRQTDKQQ